MSTTYSTTVRRNMRGEIEAITRFVLDRPDRELRITTSKASPGVSTRAQVGIVTGGVPGGFVGFQIALGIGSRGDFRKTLVHNKNGRATQKAIETLHDAALADIEPVLAEARAYYPTTAEA